ncbi:MULTISPECIES: hypothetical protein [Comamonadaceae]|uniref:Uncharacterized protein n=1 Tax=Paracidovorax valerianellae TaxID=187868 RepID=A0A1G7F8G6_9BURK|nr:MULTISPECIES: hypothetical protein [Comamonadaceae]MDA8443633.1 hypothetical protein [Paracidovorax valerianellae]WCM90571.1 hypothetical protein M5C98_11375 [Acidovorax sp. NCPPB 3576]GKS87469.1 hypothetical protein AVMA1855_24975 [Acidovorax sp. SUPP1855]SDE72154.1 hypothetical protein SAMN05192589_12728 [Paracidovorax valerianellae]
MFINTEYRRMNGHCVATSEGLTDQRVALWLETRLDYDGRLITWLCRDDAAYEQSSWTCLANTRMPPSMTESIAVAWQHERAMAELQRMENLQPVHPALAIARNVYRQIGLGIYVLVNPTVRMFLRRMRRVLFRRVRQMHREAYRP